MLREQEASRPAVELGADKAGYIEIRHIVTYFDLKIDPSLLVSEV